MLTRFRTGRTNLNLNKFTIGQTDDPSCLCHAKNETSEHFFLDCFLYTVERQTLFNLVENIVPRFPRITKKEKYHILTRGINIYDLDYYDKNIKISLAVQAFILKSKRFSDTDTDE